MVKPIPADGLFMLRTSGGEVIVITGASSGIGAALALEFASSGYRVALLARRTDRLSALARDLGSDRALYVTTDVTDFGSVRHAYEQILAAWGRIGVLVNNAGIYPPEGPLWQLPTDDWLSTINTNLTGTFNCIRQVLPLMLEQEYGRIVNVSSRMVGDPQAIAYSISKSGVDLLTTLLGKELADQRGDFRCWSLDPGNVRTEMNPEGEQDPQSVAIAVRQLLDCPEMSPAGLKISLSPSRGLTR